MRKKENQRIALTRRLLKESLLQLMSEKNIQAITVRELCETAEINRSTFYNHYGCPADVLKEIEMDIISDLAEIWEEHDEGKGWSINKRVETLCSYLLEHKKTARLLLRDSDTNSEFAVLLFQAAHVRSVYEESFAYEKNTYHKQLMITFLTNGSYHMLRQWILEDIPMTPKEIGDLIYLAATQGWERMETGKESVSDKR